MPTPRSSARDRQRFAGWPSTACDRILFASDSPFDPERGPGYIRDTIKVLESIEMSDADREKISFRNARALFGLSR